VTLPAVEPQPGQPADRKQQERRRHRIVLIEDNEDARHSLAAALTLDGHQVHEAADGISGIAALARVNPDIAVVDIGLPGVDGYKVAETLRGAPEHDSMVLIALTGYGQPDSLRRAREAGFDEYVTKPIAPERLVRLMDVALEARARRAAIPAVPRDRSPEPRSPAGH
jgi:CheY-like chemotaxis protein